MSEPSWKNDLGYSFNEANKILKYQIFSLIFPVLSEWVFILVVMPRELLSYFWKFKHLVAFQQCHVSAIILFFIRYLLPKTNDQIAKCSSLINGGFADDFSLRLFTKTSVIQYFKSRRTLFCIFVATNKLIFLLLFVLVCRPLILLQTTSVSITY